MPDRDLQPISTASHGESDKALSKIRLVASRVPKYCLLSRSSNGLAGSRSWSANGYGLWDDVANGSWSSWGFFGLGFSGSWLIWLGFLSLGLFSSLSLGFFDLLGSLGLLALTVASNGLASTTNQANQATGGSLLLSLGSRLLGFSG